MFIIKKRLIISRRVIFLMNFMSINLFDLFIRIISFIDHIDSLIPLFLGPLRPSLSLMCLTYLICLKTNRGLVPRHEEVSVVSSEHGYFLLSHIVLANWLLSLSRFNSFFILNPFQSVLFGYKFWPLTFGSILVTLDCNGSQSDPPGRRVTMKR